MACGNGDVVEEAETHRAAAFGMMSRGPNHCQRARATAAAENVLHGADRRARCQSRHVIRLGRSEGIGIERDRASCRLSDERDVLASMDPCEFVLARFP